MLGKRSVARKVSMLSLTRSLKNELPDTKYSIKKAYLLQAICYGNAMHIS